MADLTLQDISEKMRDIDFAILSTRTSGGAIAARPMSNNRQVEYDGDNFFFTLQDTGSVRDITGDPNVGLSFQG
jgi:general stress protein 26